MSENRKPPVARTAEDLTPHCLTAVLSAESGGEGVRLESVRTTPIGTGQMSTVDLAEARYAPNGPAESGSFVIKLASTNDTIRKSGLAMGLDAAEVRFYQEIAPTVAIDLPRCHFGDVDSDGGWSTLVIAHQPTAAVGDAGSAR
jgi:hypothetical protein